MAVTLGALCFASTAATPAIAQGTNAIHIEITDGPDAGTYDLTTSEPCQAGTSVQATGGSSCMTPARTRTPSSS